MEELSRTQPVEQTWVANLLQELHELQTKNAARGSPDRSLLALHMQGGWSTEGWLLDYGSSHTLDNQPLVIIYPSSTGQGDSIVRMPVENIKAITILKAVEPAPSVMSALSAGDLEQPVQEIAQLLFHIVGKVIPGEVALADLPQASYPAFEKQLKALYSGVMQILAFPVAREVFMNRIHAFKIQFSSEMTVYIQDTTLRMTLPIEDLSLPDFIAAIVSAFA